MSLLRTGKATLRTLVAVPVFKTVTHLPPFMGVMFGLGLLWLVGDLLHRGKSDDARRPLTLVRCPSGRGKNCFYQKHDAGTFGDKVHRIPIEEKKGDIEDYLYIDGAWRDHRLFALLNPGFIRPESWPRALG